MLSFKKTRRVAVPLLVALLVILSLHDVAGKKTKEAKKAYKKKEVEASDTEEMVPMSRKNEGTTFKMSDLKAEDADALGQLIHNFSKEQLIDRAPKLYRDDDGLFVYELALDQVLLFFPVPDDFDVDEYLRALAPKTTDATRIFYRRLMAAQYSESYEMAELEIDLVNGESGDGDVIPVTTPDGPDELAFINLFRRATFKFRAFGEVPTMDEVTETATPNNEDFLGLFPSFPTNPDGFDYVDFTDYIKSVGVSEIFQSIDSATISFIADPNTLAPTSSPVAPTDPPVSPPPTDPPVSPPPTDPPVTPPPTDPPSPGYVITGTNMNLPPSDYDIVDSVFSRVYDIVVGDITDQFTTGSTPIVPYLDDCEHETVIDDIHVCVLYLEELRGTDFLSAAVFPSLRPDGDANAGLPYVVGFGLNPELSPANEGEDPSLFENVALRTAFGALGVGTLWDRFDLNEVDLVCGYKRETEAYRQFAEISGCEEDDGFIGQYIPLAFDSCITWDGDFCFDTPEIFATPYLYTQLDPPVVSKVTVGSLQDLGYTVNMDGADDYGFDDLNFFCQCQDPNGAPFDESESVAAPKAREEPKHKLSEETIARAMEMGKKLAGKAGRRDRELKKNKGAAAFLVREGDYIHRVAVPL